MIPVADDPVTWPCGCGAAPYLHYTTCPKCGSERDAHYELDVEHCMPSWDNPLGQRPLGVVRTVQ